MEVNIWSLVAGQIQCRYRFLNKNSFFWFSTPVEIWNEDFSEGSDIGYSLTNALYGHGISAFLVPPGFCSKNWSKSWCIWPFNQRYFAVFCRKFIFSPWKWTFLANWFFFPVPKNLKFINLMKHFMNYICTLFHERIIKHLMVKTLNILTISYRENSV